MSLFQKKLNTRREAEDALRTIVYMENPPERIFHLIIQMLEGSPYPHGTARAYAYQVFMSFEITDKSILEWLQSRMEKEKSEATLIRRALQRQEKYRWEKLPRDERASFMLSY